MEPGRIAISTGNGDRLIIVAIDDKNIVSYDQLQRMFKGLVNIGYRDSDSNGLIW